MTTTPKPTPPPTTHGRPAHARAGARTVVHTAESIPDTAGLALPTIPATPDVAPDTLGHIDAALALMARADQHAADAMACRALDEHGMAGRFAERERMCMKRADLLVEISKAEALDHIAQRLDRIALAQ